MMCLLNKGRGKGDPFREYRTLKIESNSIELLNSVELKVRESHGDKLINADIDINYIKNIILPKTGNSHGSFGDIVRVIGRVHDGSIYKVVVDTVSRILVKYVDQEYMDRVGQLAGGFELLDLTSSKELIQETEIKYNKFISKSSLLGKDLEFKYVIEKDNIIYYKYLGTEQEVIIPDFITTISSQAFRFVVKENGTRATEPTSIKLGKNTRLIGNDLAKPATLSKLIIEKHDGEQIQLNNNNNTDTDIKL